MSFAEVLPDAAPGLLQRLRAETAEAHHRLEIALDILAEPLCRDRFTRLLERFWGFHAAWEPALARSLRDDAFLAPRGKLDHLRRDLLALGRTPDQVAALPLWLDAARLTADASAALGSLYVMEGSTLGGQVISRALKAAPWLPEGGLGYFDPYGPSTGQMWRGFRDYASARSAPAADDLIVDGARATFERLQAWLT
jgi:heme oxygenase